MLSTASLLGAQHNRDSVENKPAVVSLAKALSGMFSPLCGRQVVGPSLTKDMRTEHELIRINKKLLCPPHDYKAVKIIRST